MSRSTPTITTKEKQQEILRMRRDGMSFPKIARHFGNTQGYVYKLYRKALSEIIVEDVKEVRKFELFKLDLLEKEVIRVLQSFHPYISSGNIVRDFLEDENGNIVMDEEGKPVLVKLKDDGATLAAIEKALKIMERRSKLLGLDTPNKVALTDPSGEKAAPVTIVATPLDEKL